MIYYSCISLKCPWKVLSFDASECVGTVIISSSLPLMIYVVFQCQNSHRHQRFSHPCHAMPQLSWRSERHLRTQIDVPHMQSWSSGKGGNGILNQLEDEFTFFSNDWSPNIWWHHDMDPLSAWLSLCAGKPPIICSLWSCEIKHTGP